MKNEPPLAVVSETAVFVIGVSAHLLNVARSLGQNILDARSQRPT